MFSPQEISCSDECLEIKFMTCPLKGAWQKVGVDDDELVTLLHIASSLDEGTMDAGGFDLDIQTWQPGEVGCCKLKVSKR